ncbi:glycosyltransferase [Patulibacter minatonensis]|uniref:glycosyltransferase n=1 Tax=Patulibacter minatonensis TaxID=298163 RepID=UPI0004AE6C05|nr:glycosyltransferase [Patulibacter minatonensis]
MAAPLYLRHLRRLLTGLPRRAALTVQHLGWAELGRRVATAPVRLLPGSAVGGVGDASGPARAWYKRHGRPVAIVIPSYGSPDLVATAVKSVRKTTDAAKVRIVVTDDGSAPEHVTALEALAKEQGFEVVLGAEQAGFAANCNRGLRTVRRDEDAVLLNSDVVAQRGWLAALQYAAHRRDYDLVGSRLLYPDTSIQHGGVLRNRDQPQWFDHRFRFQAADFPPANVEGPTLAATGAALYVTRGALDELGELDEGFGMAYEDVDYALRAWAHGLRVGYAPASVLIHHESKTRGTVQGDREIASQQRFWDRWGDRLDHRPVRAEDGGLRVIYVTQDTGIGGGHRVIFTHLNGLLAKGHHPELWTLDEDGGPDWFDLDVPVRQFASYAELAHELGPIDAIKVATWWETSSWVWEASVLHGIPVYLVQDVESSYYASPNDHAKVHASYRPEFAYLAGSIWVAEELKKLGVADPLPFTPGLDVDTYKTLPGVTRTDGTILSTARSNPLKDFPLTREAYGRLPDPKPHLTLFGSEPELAEGLGDAVTFLKFPSDEEVNVLLNETSVLVQTSKHEGFCLPPLEAMAAGAAVVCTDSNGNRDFCVDGENCLMPGRDPQDVADALRRLLTDADLRARLIAAGHETAASYAWPRKIDALEAFYTELADTRADSSAARTPAG